MYVFIGVKGVSVRGRFFCGACASKRLLHKNISKIFFEKSVIRNSRVRRLTRGDARTRAIKNLSTSIPSRRTRSNMPRVHHNTPLDWQNYAPGQKGGERTPFKPRMHPWAQILHFDSVSGENFKIVFHKIWKNDKIFKTRFFLNFFSNS